MTGEPLPESSSGLDPALVRWLDRQLGRGGAAAGEASDLALLARVAERVMNAIRAEAVPVHHTVRAGQGPWEVVAPGVERKVLWDAGEARCWMVRLAPGAVVDAHVHPVDEECVVLRGSLAIGDLVLQAGDFHAARRGSHHALTASREGALVYLRGACASQAD